MRSVEYDYISAHGGRDKGSTCVTGCSAYPVGGRATGATLCTTE